MNALKAHALVTAPTYNRLREIAGSASAITLLKEALSLVGAGPGVAVYIDRDGYAVGDAITTQFEPWPHLADRYKVYKGNRGFPMIFWACDADGILHPIPEVPNARP